MSEAMVNSETPKQSVTVTREELYEQVWTTPLSHLAVRYGVSGTSLSKICSRADIPCPPNGYWSKLAAGRRVVKPLLPKAATGASSAVRIAPTPVRRAALQITQGLRQKLDDGVQKAVTLEVPESLRRPHTVVATWIADHARRVAQSKRDRSEWAPRVEPLSDLDHRRHRILDTFLKQAEKLGYKVMSGQFQEVWLETGKNRLDFTLQERIRQVRRPLKSEERHRWNPNQQWTQEKVRTGELVLKFKTNIGPGIKESWTDSPEQPLEQQLAEIIAVLTVAVTLLEQARLDAEARRQKQQEEEDRRRKEADRRKVEDNRWRRFTELSERWEIADRARKFIAALEAAPPEETASHGGRTNEEWLAWLRQRLAAFDPLEAGSDAIWRNLAGVTSWEYRD